MILRYLQPQDFSEFQGRVLPYPFLAPSICCISWCSLAYRHITPVSGSVFTWSLSSVFLCICNSSKDISPSGLRPILNQYDLISSTISSVKPLFPNKITFTSTVRVGKQLGISQEWAGNDYWRKHRRAST